MANPYDVLGVSENSSEEQIKAAYKSLARKYHEDNYTDSPLSDLAREKMDEIDRAYDAIMSERRGDMNGRTAYSEANLEEGNQEYYESRTQYPDVRRRIDEGRLDDAITILDGIPVEVRTAEWYYLKGVIQQKRGWIEEAYRNYKTANDMDPNNVEYQKALDGLESGGNKAKEYTSKFRRAANSCGLCNFCMGLMCCDTCCGCCGDDCC